jgi:hypothetical protein
MNFPSVGLIRETFCLLIFYDIFTSISLCRYLCLRDCMLQEEPCLPVLKEMKQLRYLDVLMQSPRTASFAGQHTWFYYVGR